MEKKNLIFLKISDFHKNLLPGHEIVLYTTLLPNWGNKTKKVISIQFLFNILKHK